MIGYAALRWDTRQPGLSNRVAALARLLGRDGLSTIVDTPGWMILADRGTAPLCRALTHPHHFVVGHVFDRRATDHSRHATGHIADTGRDFASLCAFLVRSCWGSYVALGIDPVAPHSISIFRDPIGTDECLTWVSEGLRIVTSRPDLLLSRARPGRFAVDWDRVAQLLQYPGSAGETVPLLGVENVPTGTILVRGDGTVQDRCLWSPARFATRAASWERPPEECLPDLIDACVGAWASTSAIAIAELSGGLDSAIVASSLVRARHRPVTRWFNYYAPDAPGDERPYARAVAAQLGLPLDEVRSAHRPIDAELVDTIPLAVRPNVASLSLIHHADLAARGTALGATCLFTGQGGDALFFQAATPLLARELWRACPAGLTRPAALAALARWSGGSVWSVLGAALRAQQPRVVPPAFPVSLVPPDRRGTPPAFAWLADVDDLPPAKQLQILLLTMCRATFARTWTSAVMAVAHPLYSQPLVERVLSLSALTLTRATRDRALIRTAYARRLPPALLARHGKGCVSASYGRVLAASVPFLRDYLLDGVLANEQVLDRAALESCLTVEMLMQRNIYAEIYTALFMERWARAWTKITTAGTALPA